MANSPTVAIGFTFRDRDGNRAKATCYCPFTVAVADVWILAFSIAGRMEALSNALLQEIELTWRYRVDAPALADSDADLSRKILMLITNDLDEINAIVIPSPQAAIWEAIGAYAGIRLDLASAGAVGFSEMLLTFDLRTEDDRALGIVLETGGLQI